MKHPPATPYKPWPRLARPPSAFSSSSSLLFLSRLFLRLPSHDDLVHYASRLTTHDPRNSRMSVTMLAPIAETSAMSWARHNSAPDLRTMDAPRAGSEGVRRSGTPITYVCLSCRAPIAADASIVARVRPPTTSFYL